MSYAMLVDDIAGKFWDPEESWETLTWNVVTNNDKALRTLYEGAGYDDEYYNELDDEQKMGYIRNSEAFYELKEGYYPIMSYVHLLQERPREEDILKIHNNAPNTVIIEDNMGNHYIGLSGGGMDFSEEIAYAYMLIDRCIPPCFRIDEDSNYLLKKEAHKELVEFLNKGRD